MKYYLDSSALVKLYVPEKESAALTQRVSGVVLPFTQFHELEVKNAIMLRCFRDPALVRIGHETCIQIDLDLDNGVLCRPELLWNEIFHSAMQLSLRHTSAIGCRSLDIIHVAAAEAAACKTFITYDDRQTELAKAAGLNVLSV